MPRLPKLMLILATGQDFLKGTEFSSFCCRWVICFIARNAVAFSEFSGSCHHDQFFSPTKLTKVFRSYELLTQLMAELCMNKRLYYMVWVKRFFFNGA